MKYANICIFKELNVDMLVHDRCAPGHSYTNPAERVRSVLNLGLQNRKTAHWKEFNVMIREGIGVKCQDVWSIAETRAFEQKKTDIKTQWKESVEPVQSHVRNRFMQLRLNDEPIGTLDPASDEGIDIVKLVIYVNCFQTWTLTSQINRYYISIASTRKMPMNGISNVCKKKHGLISKHVAYLHNVHAHIATP